MKMVKSLLLGSATGLVAIAGAQAADLPVKAKPVQYVKICSLYGAGFYYIPGTDTCLKVGGFLRTEVNVNTRGGSFAQWQATNFDNDRFNDTFMRARGVATFDARSETAYGTLRSYLNIGEQYTSGALGGGPGLFAVWLNRGFVQFAGFTLGRAVSFFDFDPVSAYSNQTNTWGSSSGGAGIITWAYTAQFGNGFSASISAEEPGFRRTQILGTGIVAGAGGVRAGYGGLRWPDVVGNLRVDQSWGSAQIMGAIHDVNPQYYTAPAVGTGPGDEVGYALGAGLKLNLPMLGHGDFLMTQFTYAKGALNYVGSGLPGGIGYNIQNNTVLPTVAFGPVYDATYGVTGGLDLTEGWSVTAGLQHNWMPGWKTSLYGAYGEINYSALSSLRIAAAVPPGALAGGAAPPAPIAGSANWSMYQIGSRTVWTPVKNLDISLEAMYNHVNTAYSNTPGYEDKGWWAGIFRVQRNFYP